MEEWLAHPFTRNLTKAYVMQRESALKAVLKAACTSIDPIVTKAWSRHAQLDAVVKEMEKKNA